MKYLAAEGGKSEIAFQSVAARSLVGVLDELPYVSGNVLVPAKSYRRGWGAVAEVTCFGAAVSLVFPRCARSPLSEGSYQMFSSGRYEGTLAGFCGLCK